MGSDAPPCNETESQPLGARERLPREGQQIDGEISQRAQNIGHDEGRIPACAGKNTEGEYQNEVAGDSVPRRNGAHHEPDDKSNQQALQGNDRPGRDIPVEGQDDEAVKEGTDTVILRKPMQEQGPRHDAAVGEIGHRVRINQRKAVKKHRPGEEKRAQQPAPPRKAQRRPFARCTSFCPTVSATVMVGRTLPL